MYYNLHVQTRQENLLCYYAMKEHMIKGIDEGGNGKIRMAHAIYDNDNREFIKYRTGRTDLMNKMLEVQRARMDGLITPEMERLVNEHA